jgi:aryl-alcohol dehydrogenase-like predicted oxidoreductase
MIFNNLGSTGIQVSRICLGMMSYGSNRFQSWVLAPAEGVRFVRMALESGINFFDTADFYSQGQSEETLGRAVAQLTKRENVVLATKVGMPVGPGPNDRGLSRKHIFAAVDASLRRLKTDYIDLYQLHNPDPETPIEETLSAMADVVRAGKARYIGASNYASWELALANRAMHTDHSMRIATTQMEYNLTFREVERELVPMCLAEGIGGLAYSPLARGWLAGNRLDPGKLTKREKGRAGGDMKAIANYGSEHDRQIAVRLAEIAKERGVSPARMALAWLLSRPVVNAVICGMIEPAHLKEAVAATDLRLSSSEISRLEVLYQPQRAKDVHAPINKSGERPDEAFQGLK